MIAGPARRIGEVRNGKEDIVLDEAYLYIHQCIPCLTSFAFAALTKDEDNPDGIGTDRHLPTAS
jgi:hypothetical protein